MPKKKGKKGKKEKIEKMKRENPLWAGAGLEMTPEDSKGLGQTEGEDDDERKAEF